MSLATPRPLFWSLLSATIAALVAVVGSVYLSMGLGLIACPICLYQRAFAMATLGVLMVGWLTKARMTGYIPLLAFLPTVTGGLIATIHSFLHLGGAQICPKGLFGIGHTPEQSVGSYVVILGCLLPGLAYEIVQQRLKIGHVLWTFLFGAALAYVCIIATPGVPTSDKPSAVECYAPAKPAGPPIRLEEDASPRPPIHGKEP